MAHIAALVNGAIDGGAFRGGVTVLCHGQVVLRQACIALYCHCGRGNREIEYKMLYLNPELSAGDSIQFPIDADQGPENSRRNRPRKCRERALQ